MPFTVTSGSPFASSVSLMSRSVTTTSTTCGPAMRLSNRGSSAETNRLALAAWAAGMGPGAASATAPTAAAIASARQADLRLLEPLMPLIQSVCN